MVVSCCVVGCTNRAIKESGKRFYRIPEVYGLGVDTMCTNASLQVIDGRFSGFFPILHLTDSKDPS